MTIQFPRVPQQRRRNEISASRGIRSAGRYLPGAVAPSDRRPRTAPPLPSGTPSYSIRFLAGAKERAQSA